MADEIIRIREIQGYEDVLLLRRDPYSKLIVLPMGLMIITSEPLGENVAEDAYIFEVEGNLAN